MTLEDLETAKTLAATRELVMTKLEASEGRPTGVSQIFGVTLDDEMKEAVRGAMRTVLRDRLLTVETTLQDMGIIIPDALEPRGWDPLAGVADADPVQP